MEYDLNIYIYSITVVELHPEKFGSLVWRKLTLHLHIYQRSYSIVARRNTATLLPIIQRTVLPGTTVWSDQWSSYNRVGQIPGVVSHGVVNHSLTFVNQTTGVHTQAIESYWNRVKTKFKRMKGVSEAQLPSYLDEFMWRERHGKTSPSAFLSIVKHIAECYPV